MGYLLKVVVLPMFSENYPGRNTKIQHLISIKKRPMIELSMSEIIMTRTNVSFGLNIVVYNRLGNNF